MEPHVNTFYMETVITFRQDPTRLIFFQLRQANSAFQGAGLRGESKNWEGIQDTRVKATRGGGGGIARMKNYVVGAAAGLTAASTEEVPTSVDMKREHENHNKE